MRSVLLLGITAVVLAARPGPADACSFDPLPAHELDPLADDLEAPQAPEVIDVEIQRGKGEGCDGAVTSCDDIGFVTIRLAPGVDDQTAPAMMGYSLRVVDGALPPDLALPDGVVRLDRQSLFLRWVDGATDDQDRFTATLAIQAHDRAGNTGPEVEVEISDSGASLGCATGQRAGLTGWLLIAFALLLSVRRRTRWWHREPAATEHL